MTETTFQGQVPCIGEPPAGRLKALESSADGWRGRIGVEFTPERALTIVWAILDQHDQDRGLRSSHIVVGYDSRHLSEQVARMASAAIREYRPGDTVTLIRHLPTSTASFLVSCEFDLAILVTASHNPANWNGIKVKIAPGISAPPEFVAGVDARNRTLAPLRIVADAEAILARDAGPFFERHVRAVVDALPGEARRTFRVVIDGLGGIGEAALERLGVLLGWQVLPSRRTIDTTLCNQIPDPSKAGVLEDLRTRVVSERADFGLALDGDGDRIFAVTHEGDIVPSHDLMALLVLHARERGRPISRIAITQSTGLSVRRVADELGAEIVETPIGFKYISRLLNDGSVDAGVGAVGDMAFRSFTSDRDPLFVAAQLSQLLNQSDVPLSTALNRLRLRLGTAGLNWIELHMPQAGASQPEALDAALDGAALVAGVAPDLRERLTGGAVRLRAAGGAWIMLRPSTTEGGLRVYGELFSSEEKATEIQMAITHGLNTKKQGRLT
jgi:phosphomannomutase